MNRNWIKVWIGMALATCAAQAAEEAKMWAPADNDNIGENPPPGIVLLGTKDEYVPVETGKRFQRLMKEKGGRCDLHLDEGKKHGFFNLWIGKEDLAITLVEADRFLASLGYLKGEPILDLGKVEKKP